MHSPAEKPPVFTILPVTPPRWPDLELLFGPRGACGGCWCMFWRQTRSEYEKMKGESNRLQLKSLVDGGEIPGLIAYATAGPEASATQPVGWISVGPRQAFSALQRSRLLKPVDDLPAWSIVCFFVNRHYRRHGLTAHLVQAAVQYAASQGARIVEGYPVDPAQGKYPDTFAYTGLPGPFLKAGFVEVARRSQTRPVLRYYVGGGP